MKHNNVNRLVAVKNKIDQLFKEINQPAFDSYHVKNLKNSLPQLSEEVQKIYLEETSTIKSWE